MRIILLSCLLLSFFTADARKLYLRTGFGYAWPLAGQTLNANGYPYSGSARYLPGSGISSYEVRKVSFTEGVTGIAGFGLWLGNNLALELNAHIGIAGKKHTSNSSYPAPSSGNYYESYTQYAKAPLLLSPALLIRTGDKRISGYARIGAVVPVRCMIIGEFEIVQSGSQGQSATIYGTEEIRTFTNIGFSGALGCSYKLSEQVAVFSEMNVLALSLYARESYLTRYEVNTQDVLDYFTEEERTVRFTNRGTSGSRPSYSYPMSNMGLTAGFTILL